MILNATGFEQHSLKPPNCSAQVLVKPVTPLRPDQRPPVLGRANPVVVEAMVSRPHGFVRMSKLNHARARAILAKNQVRSGLAGTPPGCGVKGRLRLRFWLGELGKLLEHVSWRVHDVEMSLTPSRTRLTQMGRNWRRAAKSEVAFAALNAKTVRP